MTTADDKRIKKFLKDFFKYHSQFKEVPYSSKPDAVLVYKKNDLTFHKIVILNEVRKKPLPEGDGDWVAVYLKNSNPHDSRKTTRGYVRRSIKKTSARD